MIFSDRFRVGTTHRAIHKGPGGRGSSQDHPAQPHPERLNIVTPPYTQFPVSEKSQNFFASVFNFLRPVIFNGDGI